MLLNIILFLALGVTSSLASSNGWQQPYKAIVIVNCIALGAAIVFKIIKGGKE